MADRKGIAAMAVRTYWDEESATPYTLDDDGLVLPADATDAERFAAWEAVAEAEMF